MPNQPKLLDVPISQAQEQAEIYSTMAAFIRQKQEELKAQAEIVLEKMKGSGQRLLTFKDEFGTSHRFEIIETEEKLKYSSKGEAAV